MALNRGLWIVLLVILAEAGMSLAQTETMYYHRTYQYGNVRKAEIYKKGKSTPELTCNNGNNCALWQGVPARAGCEIVTKRYQMCGDADYSSGAVWTRIAGTLSSGQSSYVQVWAGRSSSRYISGPNVYAGIVNPTRTCCRNGQTYGGYTQPMTLQRTFMRSRPLTFPTAGTHDHDGIKCYGKDMNGVTIEDTITSTFRLTMEFEYKCFDDCNENFFRPDFSKEACTKCKDCADGEYETGGCTTWTGDRKCAKCTARPSTNHYQHVPCSTESNAEWVSCGEQCAKDEFELISCTEKTKRLCKPISEECSATEVEVIAPSETNDRLCLPRTVCQEGEYEASAGDKSTDRLCLQLSQPCDQQGKRTLATPTATSDWKCGEACDEGLEYLDGDSCKKYTNCTLTGRYIKTPGSATRDNECATPQPCLSGTYLHAPFTTTSDNDCRQLTTCSDGEYMVAGGTPTSDTVCMKKCFECPIGQYAVEDCGSADRTVCEPCTECSVGEIVVASCSHGGNRKCEKAFSEAFTPTGEAKVSTNGGNVIIGTKKHVILESAVLVGEDIDGNPTTMSLMQEIQNLRAELEELKQTKADA